ncbi:MAG TPA: hypothetical protein VLC10_02695, partial [Patescibacteria group bacterium]|nr:hypothetical protein [Patescibacteria group bacterium]
RMPTIQINFDYFVELGNLPFPLLMARIFLDGGWVPVLLVMLQGLWLLWVQSRQEKFAATVAYTVLAIDIPRNNEQTPKAAEQIFTHLSGAHSGLDAYEKYWKGKFNPSFSFELVSVDGYVQYLVHCPKKFRDLVESSIYAQYPEAEISEVPDYVDKVPRRFPDPEWDCFGTEFVLKKPAAYPIRTFTEFEDKAAEEMIFKDPMSAILEVMSGLKRGEQMWLQFRVTPVDESWQKKGEEVVDKIMGKKKVAPKGFVDYLMEIPMAVVNELMHGGEEAPKEKKPDQPKIASLSPGERKVLEKIQEKLAKVGFMVKIRVVYLGRRDVFNKGRMSQLKGAMSQFTAVNMNAFKGYGPVTPKGDYFWQRWSENDKKTAILRNYRNRSGKGATPYALNIEELATLYHFPMLSVKAPLVKKTEAKRAEPPSSLPAEGFFPSVEIKAPTKPSKKNMDEDGDGLPDNLPFG